MKSATLASLRCPRKKGKSSCLGDLRVEKVEAENQDDLSYATLACSACRARFPVLAGVAILVHDVRDYLLGHVKGVSKLVPLEKIPVDLRRDFKAACDELAEEGAQHIEEDLEADRVTSLYLMTHFLSASSPWWRADPAASGSPAVEELIRKFWDHGPMARIAEWGKKEKLTGRWIEIGCGVGGLGARLARDFGVESYLGVDSSFASIALARHVVLGTSYPEELRGPSDLIRGQLPQKLDIRIPVVPEASSLAIDYVVGEVEDLPVVRNFWDVSASLNMIDMLEDPSVLPRIQNELVRPGGNVIQSCPYIWHPEVVKTLKKMIPRDRLASSSSAVEWLYEKAGLKIQERVEHLPWLFFKHSRQIELYSVHLMRASRQ